MALFGYPLRFTESFPDWKARWLRQLLRRLSLRRLFDGGGVAVARGGKVRIPARHGAEHQLDPPRVAGRHRAAPVLRAKLNRLTTHRADRERRHGTTQYHTRFRI